jgi:hypothetical protein
LEDAPALADRQGLAGAEDHPASLVREPARIGEEGWEQEGDA